jgi:hypothetical protein
MKLRSVFSATIKLSILPAVLLAGCSDEGSGVLDPAPTPPGTNEPAPEFPVTPNPSANAPKPGNSGNGWSADPIGPNDVARDAMPGDLLITEVMVNPPRADYLGQWFEVLNTTTQPIILTGLTIMNYRKGEHDKHNCNPPVAAARIDAPNLILQAGAFGLFVRDTARATQYKLPASAILYDYPSVNFSGRDPDVGVYLYSNDRLIASAPLGAFIDDFWFSNASVQRRLKPLGVESKSSSWCLSRNYYDRSMPRVYGTPGQPDDCK